MIEDKTEQVIAKGHRAARLLDDPGFQEACSYIRENMMKRWEISPSVEERERIWHCIGVLEQLKGALNTAYQNGKLSKRRLDDLVGRKPS